MSTPGRSWYAGSANQPSGNGLTCSACGEPCSALYPGELCKKHWEETLKPEPKPRKKNPTAKRLLQRKLDRRKNARKWKRKGGSLNKKAYNAKYYAEHREERKARQTKYRTEHREKIKEYRIKYNAEHCEERKIYQAKYRARVRRSKRNKEEV